MAGWREPDAARTARPRGRGELILPMIRSCWPRRACARCALDAIAFGRGPGAFTGVRLGGCGGAGSRFAAGLPLLPVSDLRALAAAGPPQPDAAAARAGLPGCPHGRGLLGVLRAQARRRIALPVTPGRWRAVADRGSRLPEPWEATAVCGAGSGFEAYRAQPGWRPESALQSDLGAACVRAPARSPAWRHSTGLSGAVAPEWRNRCICATKSQRCRHETDKIEICCHRHATNAP